MAKPGLFPWFLLLATIGKSINLNARWYTVVGVIPGNFSYHNSNLHRNAEVFVPIGQWDEKLFRERRASIGMNEVGRLKPGDSFEQANAEMSAVAAYLAELYPDIKKDSGIMPVPLNQNVVGEIRPFLLVLLAVVGFVLLIACANVTNLLAHGLQAVARTDQRLLNDVSAITLRLCGCRRPSCAIIS